MDRPTRDTVARKVADLWPAESIPGVLGLLDRYQGNERERVQLAVLKLAALDIEQLKRFVATACMDYRDVLYGAGYPRESKLGFTLFTALDPAERERVRRFIQRLEKLRCTRETAASLHARALENLRSYPAVRHALDENRVELHGWVYDLAERQLCYYDASQGVFVRFSPSGPQAAE